MKYLTVFFTCLVLNACSMKVEKTYQSSEGDFYVVKVENNRPVILHTFASNGHTRIVDKCVVFDDKNWECDNSLRMKNGIFYKFDELLKEVSNGSTKSVRETGEHGLSKPNQSNSINQSNSDKDKISSIKKNGVDGWGFAQEVFSKSGDDSLLLLNPNDKNSFRVISYYSYIQYNTKHTKIIGDKIIPMAEAFKIISLNEEADPNFKKALHYEEKLLLKKQGWDFIRLYYENANKCSSNAYVLDYYNASLNKIKKDTYCNGVKAEQILDPYIAEQIYVKSGMGKGD